MTSLKHKGRERQLAGPKRCGIQMQRTDPAISAEDAGTVRFNETSTFPLQKFYEADLQLVELSRDQGARQPQSGGKAISPAVAEREIVSSGPMHEWKLQIVARCWRRPFRIAGSVVLLRQ